MTTTDTGSNPYEDAARQRKAARLAVVLIATGTSADDATTMTPAARGALAAVAQVTPPSPPTWEIVVDLLRLHDRVAATL